MTPSENTQLQEYFTRLAGVIESGRISLASDSIDGMRAALRRKFIELEGVTEALPEAPKPVPPNTYLAPYFADGPCGFFFTDDIDFANRLVAFVDPDGDDWTITDLRAPGLQVTEVTEVDV